MPDEFIPEAASRRFGFTTNLSIIFGSFCLYVLASLPFLLSYDLWIFEDRASFLHLDELLAEHYRLGVDVFYSYGLLPVLLQHLVFLPFGRSFRPMLGCTVLVLFLNALFWAALLEHLPPQRRWLLAVVLLSPIILIVNPNWPYSLAILSIMFALLFVLRDRLGIALAIAAVGCFCIPSLTLVLTALIATLIVADWWLTPGRNIGKLASLLAPGILTYAALAALLGLVYGFGSLLATAIPLAGARFYKEMGYSGFDAFLTFLHPSGYGIKYYLAYYTASSVSWFVLCSLFLFGFSLYSLGPILRGRRLTPFINCVVLYSVVQFVFVFFVYGTRGQHVLYEGVIASVTLVGFATLPARYRNIALGVFLVAGILGETGGAYKTLTAWRTTVRSSQSFGLYADPGFIKELAEVIQLSKSHKTLVLGYATGLHNYYPTLEEPSAWFLQKGQLFPSQKQAIVEQIDQADIVVEVLTSPPPALSSDPNMQAALNAMQTAKPMIDFRVHTRQGLH